MNIQRINILGKNGLRLAMHTLKLYGYHRIPKNQWNPHRFVAAMSFDIDYQDDEKMLFEITKILLEKDAPATFACIGKHVQERPENYDILKHSSFEVMNHSYSHPYHKVINRRVWYSLSTQDIMQEIHRCQHIIKKFLHKDCKGFRTPHFDQSKESEVISVLKKMGFLYDSSGYDPKYCPKGSLPFERKGLIQLPCYRKLSSYYCLRKKRMDPSRWFSLLKRQIDKEANCGGFACFYFDPLDFYNKSQLLWQLITHIYRRKGKILTYQDVALEWNERRKK